MLNALSVANGNSVKSATCAYDNTYAASGPLYTPFCSASYTFEMHMNSVIALVSNSALSASTVKVVCAML
jgi:hypothetical protein